ncbi:MAG: fumarylacetoacetate hydrolase family protein [Desulfobacterales bacterium]|nr:fumarylacetoacetate hydrolase family protein [Deltaproteobacteria bacterium]MBT8359885.1 fumarylacetoacetate hydrolase family protein [Deltaproteobacteria bacterium]NNK95469.1 fumarylacetoacetate hydrolase family protein [Desulfobacterales bacterium]
MRFVSFEKNGQLAVGSLVPDENCVINLTGVGLPDDLNTIVEMGQKGLDMAETAAQTGERIALSEIKILAPFPRPRRNIICVGKNYFEHSKEFEKSGFDSTSGGQTIPDAPVIFTKAPTSVTGPGESIPASSDPSHSTDYEGELAVVIGRTGRNVSKDEAFNYVCGYTVINDVTARNLQQLHKQWFLGKSLDGFCPMGPCFVTSDEIEDVTSLNVSTWVNGELRQKACVKDLIFNIPTIIETVSSLLTIIPGDIIATGTPAGVGIGFTPPKFLQPGDKVVIEIDHIGVLENTVT